MTNCRELCAALDAFVDGELAVDRAVDVECHLSNCVTFAQRVRFERAFRSSIKNVVREEIGTAEALRQRLANVLVAERNRQSTHACTSATVQGRAATLTLVPAAPTPQHAARQRPQVRRVAEKTESSTWGSLAQHRGAMRWRTLLPLAAVAAGAIVYAGSRNQPAAPSSWNHVRASDLRLSELDSYLDLMVNRHHAARQQPQSIRFFHEHDERLVPPFKLPPIQDTRLVNFGNATAFRPSYQPGAGTVFRGTSSAYEVRGHRVTFFAYEAAAAPLRARLEGHSIRGHVVYSGKRRGYSVATVEDGPVGYAMTSDLSPLESAELIASAVESRVQH